MTIHDGSPAAISVLHKRVFCPPGGIVMLTKEEWDAVISGRVQFTSNPRKGEANGSTTQPAPSADGARQDQG